MDLDLLTLQGADSVCNDKLLWGHVGVRALTLPILS